MQMEPLNISATEDTPEIIFDIENKIFTISKISLPEDATEFYEPVLNWLKEYTKNPLPKTVFDFNLEYLNTASSKQIFEIIYLINQLHKEKGKDVTIRWHYDKLDEDMEALGMRFQSLVSVNFEFVEYENEDSEDDLFLESLYK